MEMEDCKAGGRGWGGTRSGNTWNVTLKSLFNSVDLKEFRGESQLNVRMITLMKEYSMF